MEPGYGVLYVLLAILVCGVYISVSQDPCLDGNTLELDHLNKRSPFNVYDSSPLWDMAEGWFRARNYVMTTSPPKSSYCGTMHPVWLRDEIPADGVTDNLTVCLVGYGDCDWQNKIEVKNCTNFLVYKLKPLGYNYSAYCFELERYCETVTSVRVLFHNITWKSQNHTNVPGLVQHDPFINLLCSFTPSDDDTLLYHIDWYVDNNTVIKGQIVDKASLQDAILSAVDLDKAGKKINSLIHCVVGIIRSENDVPCVTKSSTLFLAGVETKKNSKNRKKKKKKQKKKRK